ncbi:S8 family serine peptidase [Lentzea sp. JNUCC 0626]|uniref:S8 family serine peptidase n=1 Tax=Lentzea sp. JNUCC 0626 TaxID=3367513 RepID=UPI0037499D32
MNRSTKLVAGLVVLLLASTAGAQAAGGQLAEPVPTAAGPVGKAKVSPRLARAGTVTAFVELSGKPAADAFAENQDQGRETARNAVRAARSEVAALTDRVVGSLRAAHAATTEVYRTSNVIPGVVVHTDAGKLRELASRPDVVAVYPIVPKTRSNSSAVQLTRAMNAWQQYGRLGDGVRIGVVDSGIDYTHANFGGPGTVEAFKAVDPRAKDPNFPTAKVVGGTDLVGEDYDPSSSDPEINTPKPDPNPIDCGGHGSHVAGSAAGYGENADGSTFTGDYAKLDSARLNDMKIGPGTAPHASLYAVKVFGCDGSTSVVGKALDWALDPNGDGDFSDRLDVVNLSLGTEFGAPDDPEGLFVRKLFEHGVLTVNAAGNAEDLYDAGGSPGATPEALSVASTRDAFVLYDGAEIVGAGAKAGQYSQAYPVNAPLDVTKPVVKVSDAGNADGCAPIADSLAGKFVWLEWDDNNSTRRCGSVTRTNNAQTAGAAGVLISSTLDNFNAGITGNDQIPAFQFTASSTAAIRPQLNAGTLNVRLAGQLRGSVSVYDQSLVDTPSSFTSRGNRNAVVKPDLAAPGDTITSAAVGTGTGRATMNGTSMAAPHVSGLAALVRQTHPEWGPAEVKAALMNTAGADVKENGKTFAPNRVGAGRVDGKAALENQVLAAVEDAPGFVSASFGVVEVEGKVSLTKTIKLTNKSAEPVEYTVAYQELTTIPGVSYQLSSNKVRVAGKASARVKVTLKINDPAALRKTSDPTINRGPADSPRQFLADASGRVQFTPVSGSAVPLRVPVYAAPKPVANVKVPGRLAFSDPHRAELTLSGKGLDQGSGSEAYRSLVSVLELQAQSPRLPDCKGSVTTGCAPNRTARGGDLQYVGVASTAPAAKAQGKPEKSLLAFGIAMWDNWFNLGVNTQPYIDIDTTGDGKPDFETYAAREQFDDVLTATTIDLKTGDVVDRQPVNGLHGDVDTNTYDTNVVVLPVSLTALGLDPAKDSARITYQVAVDSFYAAPGDGFGNVDAIEGKLTFDPLKPGLIVQGEGGEPALSYVAKSGVSLVVSRDQEALAADRSNGLLVLNLHNASGARASVVEVQSR